MNKLYEYKKENFCSNLRLLAEENNLGLIETVASYCEDTDQRMEDIIPLLDSNIIDEIRCEAIQKSYVFLERKVRTLF